MSFLLFVRNNRLNPSRRTFLSDSGLLLSASAVALLAGCETLAAGQKKSGDRKSTRLNSSHRL